MWRIFRTVRVKRPQRPHPGLTRHSEDARVLVHAKLAYWNQFYHFSYNRVSIRNQSTRWGSCSSKGNLNFNYRIVHLPERLADYLIVHELCHLGQMNHSANFWNLVAQTIPDYEQCRADLQKVSMRAML